MLDLRKRLTTATPTQFATADNRATPRGLPHKYSLTRVGVIHVTLMWACQGLDLLCSQLCSDLVWRVEILWLAGTGRPITVLVDDGFSIAAWAIHGAFHAACLGRPRIE